MKKYKVETHTTITEIRQFVIGADSKEEAERLAESGQGVEYISPKYTETEVHVYGAAEEVK